MKTLRATLLLLLLTPAAYAQGDQVVLKDGNTLTGTVKSMAGGKVVFSVKSIGDVTVPMANIQDLKTGGSITLLTKQGERLERQVTGIADGMLQLSGGAEGAPAAPSVSLDQLDQINPPKKPGPKWTGSVAVGAFLSDGNTDRRAISASGQAVRRSEMDRLTADFTWNYGEDKPARRFVLTDRRVTAGLKYDYFISKTLYAYGDTRATGDTPADIQLRYQAGGGLGYQVYEDDKVKWGLEAGLTYVSENYRTKGVTDQDYIAARAASILDYVINKNMKFTNKTEWIPGLEDQADQYLIATSKLNITLTGSMFAQIGHEFEWDATPSPGLGKTDQRFTLSVGWTF